MPTSGHWNSYFRPLALSHIFELHFAGTSSTHIPVSFFNQQSGKPLTASMNAFANTSLAGLLQGAANQANRIHGDLSMIINATKQVRL